MGPFASRLRETFTAPRTGYHGFLQPGEDALTRSRHWRCRKSLIGREDFVYVWTLGVEGLGDGQDKLVTIDVNPKSANYGKVVK